MPRIGAPTSGIGDATPSRITEGYVSRGGPGTGGGGSGNREWANEFGGNLPTVRERTGSPHDPTEVRTYTETFGSGYRPWQTTWQENLWGAMGGLTQDAGLKNLTEDQKKILFTYGEFGGPGMPEWIGGGYDDYNDQGGSWGGWGGYGGGGGGSGGGGGGYGPPEENFMPRGYPGERWGPQMPLQQAMVDIHGGKGFQQGFSRGGIVSLVT